MSQPDLSVTIGSATFKNPVFAAAGTVGYGLEFAHAVRLSELGGLITKTLTRRPREGNPPPRLAETPSGMLNAVGLQNVGLEAFLKDTLPALRDACLPRTGGRQAGTPVIVSLLGESPQELAELAGAAGRAEGVAAIELNLSCPNIRPPASSLQPPTSGRLISLVAHDPQAVQEMVAAARGATTKPLIAKLSPDVTDLIPIAQAAAHAGADAITLSNTFVGMSVDPETRRSRLGTLTGGLSGPAIRPLAVYRVWYTAQTIHLPVIGLGGIVRAEDALEFFLAGAAAVAVGTAHFADPRAAVRIVRGLTRYLERHHISALRDLRGALDGR